MTEQAKKEIIDLLIEIQEDNNTIIQLINEIREDFKLIK